MQIRFPRRIQSLFVPNRALIPRHKFHEVVIGRFRGMLPKIGPRGLHRFILSTEFTEQLAVQLVQIIRCGGSKLALAVKNTPPLDPDQSLSLVRMAWDN